MSKRPRFNPEDIEEKKMTNLGPDIMNMIFKEYAPMATVLKEPSKSYSYTREELWKKRCNASSRSYPKFTRRHTRPYCENHFFFPPQPKTPFDAPCCLPDFLNADEKKNDNKIISVFDSATGTKIDYQEQADGKFLLIYPEYFQRLKRYILLHQNGERRFEAIQAVKDFVNDYLETGKLSHELLLQDLNNIVEKSIIPLAYEFNNFILIEELKNKMQIFRSS